MYIDQHQLILFSKSVDAYWNRRYILFIFLSLFFIRNCRETCSYNEMLKGYMVVECLGILVLSRNLGDRL